MEADSPPPTGTLGAINHSRVAERRFRAMGCDVQLVAIDASDGCIDEAARRIADLETRWSRFLPHSELTRLNSHPGVPVVVSPATFDLVAVALEAWGRTDGWFDPTIIDALESWGYDASFEDLPASIAGGACAPAATPRHVELHHETRAVCLPVGVRLDLGGVGKGAAADRTVDDLIAAGAEGACVNIGGDVRVRGTGPHDGMWAITLACPGAEVGRVVHLADGAVCTSTRLRRRWDTSAGAAHHLINPRTGRPSSTDAVSTTVVAAHATEAEILAKTALLEGLDKGLERLRGHGVDGVMVDDSGNVHDVTPSIVVTR